VLPAARELGRLLPGTARKLDEVEQFRLIARHLTLSSSSELDLHHHLRPLVREIAASRLARHHGVSLDREPAQAQAIIGNGQLWALVRPDREPPEDRQARGWSKAELEQLLQELEEL